jgi:sulfatase maturation enzyme AslB (radical SAM superfamily)
VKDRAASLSVRGVTLVLTGRCNLRCAYCYQDRKSVEAIAWSTCRRAIDLLLRSKRDRLSLAFYGGEPLLEWPTIERAVGYVRRHAPRHKKVRISLLTNGTLLTLERAAWLETHRVRTRISFDGVSASQRQRGACTFDRLDRLLVELRRARRRFFKKRLDVGMTWTSATLPDLGRSFDHLLERGIRRIHLGPLVTDDPGWTPQSIELLDRQFARMYRSSRRHHARTGRIPLMLFRRTGVVTKPRARAGPICNATTGESLTVDVDGRLFGCELLAATYRPSPTAPLEHLLGELTLGHVEDLPSSAPRPQPPAMFRDLDRKHSSYGSCRHCPYRGECSICPVSIARAKDNDDPYRVPDHQCAFQRISSKYRSRFPIHRKAPVVLDGRSLRRP